MDRKLNEIKELKEAIRDLHGCDASHQETVSVREEFDGSIAWEGSVLVFSVDHADTDTCYAWSSHIEGSDRRKFYAVLKKPPVDSPAAAVRAAIVSDYRARM